MNVIWLWVIYIVVLLVAWLLICQIGKVKMDVGFVLAAIFALAIGLLLIPYFRDPNSPEAESQNWIFMAFGIVIILVPILGLIYCVIASNRSYSSEGHPLNPMEEKHIKESHEHMKEAHEHYTKDSHNGHSSGKNYTKLDATCNMEGDCMPTKFVRKSPEGRVKLKFVNDSYE